MGSTGVKYKRKKKIKDKYPEIACLLEEGQSSFVDIGKQFGLSKERIRQINSLLGLPSKWSKARERVRQYKEKRAYEKAVAFSEGNYPAEYRAYHNAKARCRRSNHTLYKWYGGRGILFLFNTFEQFIKEIGRRPEGMTLDRRENGGHYEPGNVRWITPKEQANNRRKREKHKSKEKSDLEGLRIADSCAKIVNSLE